MPEPVATQLDPPSSAARRCWNARTVGLVKREYTLPERLPAKASAASRAELKQKLEVAKIGSLCSNSCVRSCPTRTARVSGA